MTDNAAPHESPEAGPAAATGFGSLEIDQNDYGKYLLYSRAEILFVLRSVIQKGCMLTVYFDSGKHFFLTALLAISDDNQWIYFDPGSDREINDLALKAKRLVFTTMLDKVKIQFGLDGLQMAQAGKRTAFAGHLPETILRLQRREYYRLATPIVNPLRCALAITRPEGGTMPLESTALDISGGGIGLQIPSELSHLLEPGAIIPECRLHLPEEKPFGTTLCVRNSFNVTTKSGQNYLRVGCEYVDLPGTHLTLIQRYITKVERERKARAAGVE